MNDLEKISYETMIFMRSKYRLDEVGDGKDELKFKQGQKTILTIYTKEDRYTFLIIFGKKEREVFESDADSYSKYIQDYYDGSRTYHDGKWMFIDVTTPEQLEEVKKLIMIKKKPNRKPFPTEGAYYSKCGHRCDMCVHFTGMSDELRNEIIPHLTKVWDVHEWDMRCDGCHSPDCYCKDDPCHAKKCAPGKGLSECKDCPNYPCPEATVGDCAQKIHTASYTAEEITWAILPYTPFPYDKK